MYIYIYVFGMGEFFNGVFFAAGKFCFADMGPGLDSWDSCLVTEERKKLHNLVLELKGNIRVFVRVSWFIYLEGYIPRTVGRWSVVVTVVFSDVFFWRFMKTSIPRFIFKGISKKIYEQCELVWIHLLKEISGVVAFSGW